MDIPDASERKATDSAMPVSKTSSSEGTGGECNTPAVSPPSTAGVGVTDHPLADSDSSSDSESEEEDENLTEEEKKRRATDKKETVSVFRSKCHKQYFKLMRNCEKLLY